MSGWHSQRPRSGGLRLEGTAAVEYDGMVRCDFKLGPAAGKVTVERLALEVPFDPRGPMVSLCRRLAEHLW